MYGIATQGRQDAGQWVKAYKVMYSRSGVRWTLYQVGRRTVVSNISLNRSVQRFVSFTERKSHYAYQRSPNACVVQFLQMKEIFSYMYKDTSILR